MKNNLTCTTRTNLRQKLNNAEKAIEHGKTIPEINPLTKQLS